MDSDNAGGKKSAPPVSENRAARLAR